MADAFIKGAKDGGNEVKKINLCDQNITFCKGCLACQKTQHGVLPDDGDTIAQEMLTADVLVFATPIYYYEMSGQMKTMLDRANPLYSADYDFREIYLLSTAAEDEENTNQQAINGLSGWISCFSKAHLAGHLFAGGVTQMGEIAHHQSILTKSYEMSKNL